MNRTFLLESELRLWSPASPDQFDFGEFSLRKTLLDTDYYMHLADLTSYARTQEKVGE